MESNPRSTHGNDFSDTSWFGGGIHRASRMGLHAPARRIDHRVRGAAPAVARLATSNGRFRRRLDSVRRPIRRCTPPRAALGVPRRWVRRESPHADSIGGGLHLTYSVTV